MSCVWESMLWVWLECVCTVCGIIFVWVWGSIFELCVGQFGVGLRGVSLCCLWESLVFLGLVNVCSLRNNLVWV